jgi:hypothetical protein
MNYLTPEYEKNCLSEYAGGDPSKIVFLGWGNYLSNKLVNIIKDIFKLSHQSIIDFKIMILIDSY